MIKRDFVTSSERAAHVKSGLKPGELGFRANELANRAALNPDAVAELHSALNSISQQLKEFSKQDKLHGHNPTDMAENMAAWFSEGGQKYLTQSSIAPIEKEVVQQLARLGALHGRITAIENAVKGGADIDHVYASGKTLMHFAARGGHRKAVIALHEKGLKAGVKDNFGQTPAHEAAAGDHPNTISALARLHKQDGAHNDHVDLSPLLDIQDNDGRTPTLVAVEHNQARVLKAIDKIDSAYSFGRCEGEQTLLHVAAERGFTDVMRVLLDAGVSPNAVDLQGLTAADYARNNRRSEAYKLLTGEDLPPVVPRPEPR